MSRSAGERNRLISIEKLTGAVDGANQEIEAWLFVMKRWARILTATGMAAVRSSQQGIPLVPGRYSFRINYTPTGINEGYRVNDHGVFYDIRDIRHDHANREYTDLVCEHGANNG